MSNKFSTSDKKRGFTFVELLVVVTIIGVLAAIGMVSYSSANRKSRDGKRKADVEQIRAALEMYRADQASGYYPASGSLVSALTGGGYINTNQFPTTPQDGDCTAGSNSYEDCYIRDTNTTYHITISLESEGSKTWYQP